MKNNFITCSDNILRYYSLEQR